MSIHMYTCIHVENVEFLKITAPPTHVLYFHPIMSPSRPSPPLPQTPFPYRRTPHDYPLYLAVQIHHYAILKSNNSQFAILHIHPTHIFKWHRTDLCCAVHVDYCASFDFLTNLMTRSDAPGFTWPTPLSRTSACDGSRVLPLSWATARARATPFGRCAQRCNCRLQAELCGSVLLRAALRCVCACVWKYLCVSIYVCVCWCQCPCGWCVYRMHICTLKRRQNWAICV